MNIAVLLKQVPDTNSRIVVKDGRVDTSDVKWITSPYDEYALEAALQHKEATGGSVTAITVGDASADKVLKDAAAVGVDRLVRVWQDDWADLDSLGVAEALAGALREVGAEMAWAGKQAADRDMGATHAAVAELLGWGGIGAISGVAYGDALTVDRAAPGGTERIELVGPAVLGCEKGLNEPRRPNVKGIMAAKRAKVDVLDGAAVGSTPSARVAVVAHHAPAEKAAGRTFEGADSVSEVVQLLREEAKVL